MVPPLSTERLILRPLELADAEQIQVLFPQWEVVKFLAKIVPWPYPADGARTYIEQLALPAMKRDDAWHWTLRLKTNPAQLIGCINLVRTGDTNRGFWISPLHQKQGLMTEAADAVTEYWFNTLGFPKLRVTKATLNTGSHRVSEKQGMRLIAIEDRDYVSGRLPTEIWEITAEQWRSRKERTK